MLDFSIIIPAYNNLQLFQNAFQSVISQQEVDFEIIVVDDSTTNEIEQFCLWQNNNKVRYFHNQPTLGAVRNWNLGLSKVLGKYILLLHHDEYVSDNEYHLKKSLNFLEQNKCDISVVSPIVHFANGQAKNQKLPHVLKRVILNCFPSLLMTVNVIGPTACVIFNRRLSTAFNEELTWLVDVEWYYRIMKGNKIGINNSLDIISFFGHSNQITMNIDQASAEKTDQKIIRNNNHFFSPVTLTLILRNLLLFVKNALKIKNNPFWSNYEDS